MFKLLNPLEQFDVIIISNLYKNFALTNFGIMMVFNFILVLFLFYSFKSVFNLNSIEFFVKLLFNFIKDVLKDNMSIKKYSFIFLFYFVFLFILVSNLIGMTPYSITITSHLIFTLFYSLSFFIGTNIIGILYHKEKYFVLFLPEGVPMFIIPLLILIEYVSYFSRILSLSIRLFANMMAGHILMKILIGFV
jgi:F-type H+-transporting ATPase subunit a